MARTKTTSGSSQHWHLQTDEKGILWLLLDKAGSNTNVLSRDVLDQLDQHLDSIRQQLPVAVIFRSSKSSGFIAGADINEFLQVHSEQEALDLIHRGQRVFDKIEALPCPTIALIEGFCMGGGTELTLACDYRIALEESRTLIGLPEVKLGIHPAFGGLVRLTRLLSPLKSLEMLLSGRSLSAHQAKKVGLVDHIQPERQLIRAAVKIALSTPDKRTMPLSGKVLSLPLMRRLVVIMMRRQLNRKAPFEHYPAPHAILDVWQTHYGSPQMMRQEALSVARLVQGNTVGNLIRVFFLQTRLKGMGRKKDFRPRHIHVIGSGMMGGDIAAWCALKGFKVTLQDRKPKYLSHAFKRANQLFTRKIKFQHDRNRAIDRLIPDCQGHGIVHADVIIEAIHEDVEAKRAIYREVEAKMKPEAILVTSSSSLPLQTLANGLQQPQRLVGLHFFNPVAMMPLVEVVTNESTHEDVIRQVSAFCRHLGKLPFPVKSSPGFLVNRILVPYLLEAVTLYEEGVPAEAIDKAATDFGMPLGPLELADVVGLDICLSVADNLSQAYSFRVPDVLKKMVESKKSGRKTASGFYHYKKGKAIRDRDASMGDQKEIQQRLVYRLLNEAAACLREKIVEDKDLVDAGVIFGSGFAPFRGGPLQYARQQGLDALQQEMKRFEQKFGERFQPDAGWRQV